MQAGRLKSKLQNKVHLGRPRGKKKNPTKHNIKAEVCARILRFT